MISFNRIPANVRVPLFYAEMDNSQASYSAQNLRTLLIGQKLAAGSAMVDTPQLVASTDQAKQLFGVGSMLARMHAAARAQDSFGEIWAIALADDGSATAASGEIAVTGPAIESGAIALYIAGQRITVGVAVAQAAASIATDIAAAINAVADLPVTAAVNGGVTTQVDLTCKWDGATGNDITIVENYRGTLGGEVTPKGVALAITPMTGGATNPSLAPAITAMGDDEYDFVVLPYTDTTSLDDAKDALDDDTGRWSWSRQIYGHVYAAARASAGNLVTLGTARNDQHTTIAGVELDVPTPVWEYAAAYAARNAVYIAVDPARPTQTGEMVGVLPAPAGKRFLLTERQTLLNSGIATSYYGGGYVRVERAITTYQKNTWNQTDPSYLDSETMHTSAYVLRRLRGVITSKYPRHKLGNDGTQYGPGQAIVTPAVIRGELIAEYSAMERLGIVENAKAFAAALIVERDVDPNRVNVLYTPDYVNQLRVFAVLNQFRLQFAA